MEGTVSKKALNIWRICRILRANVEVSRSGAFDTQLLDPEPEGARFNIEVCCGAPFTVYLPAGFLEYPQDVLPRHHLKPLEQLFPGLDRLVFKMVGKLKN